MDPRTQALEQTQHFIDGARAAPERIIRDRTEETQNALIRVRAERRQLDDRIAYLESSVALLQGEAPKKKKMAKWKVFGLLGLAFGGLLATHPIALLNIVLTYVVAATCFGVVAMPISIARGSIK